MAEYIKGWRRNAVISTLILELAFIVLWFRSFRGTDIVNLHPIRNASLTFISER